MSPLDNSLDRTSYIREMKEQEMLAYADELVEKVKHLEEEKERFTQIANERIEQVKAQLERKVSKLDEWIEAYEFSLLQIANISTTKETKTQRKLELLSGDVVIKKPSYKFKNDNKAILEAIKEERKDLVKENVTYSLDWAGFKKELEIANGNIINKLTGEIVEIPGLEIEEVPETLVIK